LTKRTAVLGTLLALSAWGTPHAGDWDAWKPALAEHALRGLDGKTTLLSELRGDVVVLNFWASWCKPCKKELVSLNDWNQELTGRGVQILAVSIDKDLRKAERFVSGSGLSLPVYHDGPDGLAARLDLPSLPCTVVLDRAGNVIRVEQGGAEEAVHDLKNTVNSILETRPSPERKVAG
jgi:thiol-disulfide isomerase/thioredoxin